MPSNDKINETSYNVVSITISYSMLVVGALPISPRRRMASKSCRVALPSCLLGWLNCPISNVLILQRVKKNCHDVLSKYNILEFFEIIDSRRLHHNGRKYEREARQFDGSLPYSFKLRAREKMF